MPRQRRIRPAGGTRRRAAQRIRPPPSECCVGSGENHVATPGRLREAEYCILRESLFVCTIAPESENVDRVLNCLDFFIRYRFFFGRYAQLAQSPAQICVATLRRHSNRAQCLLSWGCLPKRVKSSGFLWISHFAPAATL
jgi:hypothetical protein